MMPCRAHCDPFLFPTCLQLPLYSPFTHLAPAIQGLLTQCFLCQELCPRLSSYRNIRLAFSSLSGLCSNVSLSEELSPATIYKRTTPTPCAPCPPYSALFFSIPFITLGIGYPVLIYLFNGHCAS